MNCKNCIYFKRHTSNYKNKHYGECSCNKFEYGSTYSKDEKETDKLFYSDHDDYDADFEVGEYFGCIHFKEV